MQVTSQRADGLILPETLTDLINVLQRRRYTVIGPSIRNDTLDWQQIHTSEDLPTGWTAVQAAGAFLLERRTDSRRFGFATLASSLKKHLHASEVRLFHTESPFRIVEDAHPASNLAVLGVRSCDLAALRILDRVLLEDRYQDPRYAARRERLFLIAVNCTDPSGTCFCTSCGGGPKAEDGYDLALTELHQGFYVEAGTQAGEEVLDELVREPASPEIREAALQATTEAAAKITRTVTPYQDHFDHPEWDRVAARCLGCGNCTQVCPTCFCVTVEDSSSIDGTFAERVRKWDSCFTLGHSYIHGGSVRQSLKSRYRQWLTHKFSTWHDQFGTSGCVGCGRCVTWCPAGIDVTETLAALANGGST